MTFIEAHKFHVQQELEMTVVGVGDASAVSALNSSGEWLHNMKPKDSERLSVIIPAGAQVYAVRVYLKLEKV